MKKIYIEIFITALFVIGGTVFLYYRLAPVKPFWDAQMWWSAGLTACWIVVAGGYYHQGWKVHHARSAKNVSLALPVAVFAVQCILFIKGIFYGDWSLIAGAVMVNSGVFFSIYQIVRMK